MAYLVEIDAGRFVVGPWPPAGILRGRLQAASRPLALFRTLRLSVRSLEYELAGFGCLFPCSYSVSEEARATRRAEDMLPPGEDRSSAQHYVPGDELRARQI
jgi:hypothetical protein